MIYLTVPELIYIASRVLDSEVTVRDHGLLESATARPRATVFGTDAYETVEDKAAALLHSLVETTRWSTGTSDWPWQPPLPSSASMDAG